MSSESEFQKKLSNWNTKLKKLKEDEKKAQIGLQSMKVQKNELIKNRENRKKLISKKSGFELPTNLNNNMARVLKKNNKFKVIETNKGKKLQFISDLNIANNVNNAGLIKALAVIQQQIRSLEALRPLPPSQPQPIQPQPAFPPGIPSPSPPRPPQNTKQCKFMLNKLIETSNKYIKYINDNQAEFINCIEKKPDTTFVSQILAIKTEIGNTLQQFHTRAVNKGRPVNSKTIKKN